ncbi:CBS domain-containing protein [Planctomycetota bacterium]
MLVKNFMTSDLICCSPTANVKNVVQMMVDNNIGSVLVTEKRKLAGIFTERDLMKRVVIQEMSLTGTVISDVMTSNPETVHEDEGMESVFCRLLGANFRHLPVVNKDEDVVGIISLNTSQLTGIIDSILKDKDITF